MLHSLSLHAPRAGLERLSSGWRGTELRALAGEAAGLGSLQEMRAVSRVPATPDSLFGLGCLVMHRHEGQKANTPQTLSWKSDKHVPGLDK